MLTTKSRLIWYFQLFFSYFALFISWLNNWLHSLAFAFIMLPAVGNSSLIQYRKAEVVWVLDFLRNWGFLVLHNLCCVDSCRNHAVRKICMIMSPKQHSWWSVLLQYWIVVWAIQLLSLFFTSCFQCIMHSWNLMWNFGAYQKRIISCRRNKHSQICETFSGERKAADAFWWISEN